MLAWILLSFGYHRKLGRLLGYSEADIDEFIHELYRNH
jgi:predicted DNA-binding transcriptional regulator AlpA